MKRGIFFFLVFMLHFSSSGQKLTTIIKKFYKTDIIEKEYTVLKKKKYIKQGIYKMYFKNGRLKETGKYENNKKTEEWNEYNRWGELRRKRKYEKGKLISDQKFGIWKEVDKKGKLRFYDYDKNERVMPQIPISVEYPSKAREEGISGFVKVKVTLDDKCELAELKVIKSLRPDFDTEAIKGVKSFIEKLQSYEEDCKNFEKTITVEFKND